VFGGGCSEMIMAQAVDKAAAGVAGKKSLAVESFAKALKMLPNIIAENGGYDGSDLVARLRAEHHKGNTTAGLDMRSGIVGDMAKLGIVESFKVKHQVVASASEAAEMILRIDDIIKAAPRQREDPRHM